MNQTEPDPRKPDSPSAWTRYWNKAVLHSCPDAFHQNYADEILAFWQGFFKKIKTTASLLDIATGNGAVALLARDVADSLGRTFHIEGIDAATIKPLEAAKKRGLNAEGIVFHSGTPAENTGYPDRMFDAACSQYGLEYSRLEESVPELSRILKPGGHVGLLMHHSHSAAAATSRAELAALGYLVEQTPLLGTARWLVNRLQAEGPSADPMLLMQDVQAKTQVELFGTQRDLVIQYANSHPHAGFLTDITTQTSRILQYIPSDGIDTASRNLDILEEEVHAHRARLQAMITACMDEDAVQSFVKLMENSGFSVDSCHPVYRNQSDLLGWAVLGHRHRYQGSSTRKTSGK
jgi:SAM-dependent methyltransferase